MAERFRHVAIVGKHQAPGIRPVLEEIAQFLCASGLDVSLEADTALNTGLTGYDALSHEELGRACDLAVVIGGDGTMLGFAREMAPYGIPLLGINQGRSGLHHRHPDRALARIPRPGAGRRLRGGAARHARRRGLARR